MKRITIGKYDIKENAENCLIRVACVNAIGNNKRKVVGNEQQGFPCVNSDIFYALVALSVLLLVACVCGNLTTIFFIRLFALYFIACKHMCRYSCLR